MESWGRRAEAADEDGEDGDTGEGRGGGKRLPQPPRGGRSVFGDLQVMYTA